MIAACLDAGLREPELMQEEEFKTVLWRRVPATMQDTQQVTLQDIGEATGEVQKLILVIEGEMKRSELQELLQMKHDDNFRLNYILPALALEVIEMKYKDNPNHPRQKYRLTAKGKELKKQLAKK